MKKKIFVSLALFFAFSGMSGTFAITNCDDLSVGVGSGSVIEENTSHVQSLTHTYYFRDVDRVIDCDSGGSSGKTGGGDLIDTGKTGLPDLGGTQISDPDNGTNGGVEDDGQTGSQPDGQTGGQTGVTSIGVKSTNGVFYQFRN